MSNLGQNYIIYEGSDPVMWIIVLNLFVVYCPLFLVLDVCTLYLLRLGYREARNWMITQTCMKISIILGYYMYIYTCTYYVNNAVMYMLIYMYNTHMYSMYSRSSTRRRVGRGRLTHRKRRREKQPRDWERWKSQREENYWSTRDSFHQVSLGRDIDRERERRERERER